MDRGRLLAAATSVQARRGFGRVRHRKHSGYADFGVATDVGRVERGGYGAKTPSYAAGRSRPDIHSLTLTVTGLLADTTAQPVRIRRFISVRAISHFRR